MEVSVGVEAFDFDFEDDFLESFLDMFYQDILY